jgi:hypothetical protein
VLQRRSSQTDDETMSAAAEVSDDRPDNDDHHKSALSAEQVVARLERLARRREPSRADGEDAGNVVDNLLSADRVRRALPRRGV